MATNVGVIILSKEQLVETTCHTRLDVEDNIGESVHVHYKNIRFDFTIVDFINLAKACSNALEELYNPPKLFPNIKPKNITPLKSANNASLQDNTPIKDYEIWEGENIEYFVIPQHTPWVDSKIINDPQTCNNIIEYTQEDNRVVEVFDITQEKIITKHYKGWYPFLIKSSNNWWDENTVKSRQQAYYNRFKTKSAAEDFYYEVISEYQAFSTHTRCHFTDVFPNNILVNEDYSDFRLIDIGCLKAGSQPKLPSFSQVITGDGANNLGFIDINYLKKTWNE